MKNFTLFVFAVFTFTVFSCQSEGESVIQDTTNNFTKTSPISSLISRISQYETTADNVLDGTSNCSIKLPVHGTLNGQYVYVASYADFATVQALKDMSDSDDDKIHFTFPITIVHPNYHEYSVSSEAQFDNILANYGDDSASHEVSCLNFDFPISINIYHTNNQVGSTVKIESNVEFYNFINELSTSQIVGIVFPITLTNTSAQHFTINNNTELEDVINDAVIDCSTTPMPTSLSDILTSGTWHISYCYYGNDDTNQYTGYNFTFNANGTSAVVKNMITTNGDWDIHDGMPQRLDLHFDGDQLHEIETNWDVQEFTSTYIRLRRQNSGGGGGGPQPSSYLSFTKN